MTQRPTIHRPGADGQRPWLRPVDFASPRAIAPDVENRLRKLADEFCATVSARATVELALPLELRPLWLYEGAWRDLCGVPSGTSVAMAMSASTGGYQFVVLDPALAGELVERILGASPDPARPLRSVTTTDRALLRRFTAVVAQCVTRLWQDAGGTTFELESLVPQREAATMVQPAEPTLLAALEVNLGGTYSVMHLMLPQSTLAPMAQQLARPSTRGAADDDASQAVHERISHATLAVRAELGEIKMTASEIAALEPGDRIPLRASAGDPAALRADGVPVQYGTLGRSGTHRAVQVGQRRTAEAGA